jgi:Zn-dependent protease with chaperone function
MPFAISLALVLAFILPAFILFEPLESDETIGLKLSLVVGLACFGIATAMYRTFGSWWQTRRLISEWTENSSPISLSSIAMPVYKLQHPFPVFAVVGIVKPRLFVAEQVLNTLDDSEIEAVLRHEFGHIAASDNLKRLAMKISGDILVLPIGRSIEKNWAETSERAADDYAVEHGSTSTAIDLASALIKIARLFPNKPLPPMPAMSYVVRADESLTIRIRHLMNLADRQNNAKKDRVHFLIPALLVAIATVATLATNSRILESVHDFSETVLATLR